MKKSELRQLIKEEIKDIMNTKSIMNTKDDGKSGYGEVMRKLTNKMTGGRIPDLSIKNTMRPKKIEIIFTERGRYYNITADGKDIKNGEFGIGVEKAEKYLESITGMEEIDLLYVNDDMLDEITENLKNKGIKFTWDDSMSVD
jgi:hypothetical protein